MSSATLLPGDSSRTLASATGYSLTADRRDEALSKDGIVSAEWLEIFDSVSRHGKQGIDDWLARVDRISRERGLAYRPASIEGSDPEGWSLDPIPRVLSSGEWENYEAGISQRTRLFSLLLQDIYGEQRVFREKLIPANLILGHSGFLRALHDLPPGNGVVGLGMSAFDLAKDSAGQTFVVNDRFDHPFGLGLALENRTVINKVLPRLFGRCRIRKIGEFFIDWFEFLARCSASGSGRPQIVILDASEQGEDSEVSFLANYCGITRVHPSDLTVRDGKVWIKALTGLVQVDVIWKTMSGNEIDSLEAEKPFAAGIAGLFEAVRGGGVALVSHPGSEVLQSPGFYPYLPKLCRAFLDEDLLLPPVATWWCGSPSALSHVLANLSSMVVKPVGSHREMRTQYGKALSAEQLKELKSRILDNPGGFVGQEELLVSTVPTLRNSEMVPRSSVVRMFSFLDEKDEVSVMPGGLARVSTEDGSIISTRDSGESKDVWVRSSKDEGEHYNIASELSRARVLSPDIVPSRTGENLFWTGRYAERVDVISRFAARIIEGRSRSFSANDSFVRDHEGHLVSSLFDAFDLDDFSANSGSVDDNLTRILKQADFPAGIDFNLNRFFSATQAAREEWSPSSILAIGSCYQGWKKSSKGIEDVLRFDTAVETLQLNLAAFLGLNLDSMTRDEGWALLDSGRRIERATIICGLLRYLLNNDRLSEEMETVLNESFLYILDSVRTYQSRFHDKPTPEFTARLFLGETDYPRSVTHIMMRVYEVLQKIPAPKGGVHPGESIVKQIESLNFYTLSMDETLGKGYFNRKAAVYFLDQLLRFLAELSDNLTTSYFSHTLKK